jgi:hypothetical protein
MYSVKSKSEARENVLEEEAMVEESLLNAAILKMKLKNSNSLKQEIVIELKEPKV